jgi:GH15 family glucan-1,4-alpha-glucosidase
VTAFRISREVGAGLPSGTLRAAPSSKVGRLIGMGLTLALVFGALPPALAQSSSCTNNPAPEESGPTDINAVTGNGGLTAAVNRKGTLTVLKWPSPSFYDQLEYRTTDRSQDRMGADANDGSFLGIAWRNANPKAPWKFSWLRSWQTHQRFVDADSDEILTTHLNRPLGLSVKVRDVVASDVDALLRSVSVSRTEGSSVRTVRLFSFANFNPIVSKTQGEPEADWCDDGGADNGGSYAKGADAIVHTAAGTDQSTGNRSDVALAMGFGSSSDGHSVGVDPGSSSYDDSMDAKLANNVSAGGPGDASIFDTLRLTERRTASARVIFAAHRTQAKALEVLKKMRNRSPSEVRRGKSGWWKAWLHNSPLPKGAPKAVVRLAKRSLITVRQAMDDKGLIVTSISTQAPLALDWVRNGAYLNAMLLESRHRGAVEKHNRRYAQLQSNAAAGLTPKGNWPTSMFADGVPAGDTPYEIDSTGFGIWTFWEHYRQTKDAQYLADVYDAIRKAADHLRMTPGGCVDAATDLQCFAHEEDGAALTQTIVGAQAVWLGLRSAVEAAEVAMTWGHSPTKRNDWRARKTEIRAAIETEFYDEDCKCYTQNPYTGATLLWPVRMLSPGSPAADRQAEVNWIRIARAMNGKVKESGLDARILLGNVHGWAGRGQKIERVKRALDWLASTRVTDGTGLLGGAWAKRNGEVIVMRSQPHAWHHAMFYLAALKAYGKRPYRF